MISTVTYFQEVSLRMFRCAITALQFFTSALDGSKWSASRPAHFNHGKRVSECIVQGTKWAPGPVWMQWRKEKYLSYRESNARHKWHSPSLHRVSYPVFHSMFSNSLVSLLHLHFGASVNTVPFYKSKYTGKGLLTVRCSETKKCFNILCGYRRNSFLPRVLSIGHCKLLNRR
jgi:hypothetical protein